MLVSVLVMKKRISSEFGIRISIGTDTYTDTYTDIGTGTGISNENRIGTDISINN